MMRAIPILLGLLGMLHLAAAAPSRVPVALVESVQGQVAGVEFMDYVSAGTVIKLGPKDTLVLSYIKSCWRETITGGTVIVVEEQSLVQGGQVARSKVGCDARHLQLGPREASQSAATIYRSLPRDATGDPRPALVLYGRSPVVEVGDRRGALVIDRLDAAGDRIELAVGDQPLLRGRFLDLDRAGVVLTPGGRYAVGMGTSRVDIRIDRDAQPGATPLVGRLLRLE